MRITIYTKLRNQIELLSAVLLSAHAPSAILTSLKRVQQSNHASMHPHLCKMLKKNNGHGVHTAGQIFDLSGKKFVLDFGDEMFEGLGVLNVYTFPVFLCEQNT